MKLPLHPIWLLAGTLLLLFVLAREFGVIAQLPDPVVATASDSKPTRPLRNWLTQRVRGPSATRIGKNHELVKAAFRKVVEDANLGTVQILSNKDQIALGIVVDPNGYILTKASELRGKLVCRVPGDIVRDAKTVGVDPEYDLAMLKIDAADLKPVRFATGPPPVAGSWLATPSGFTDDPVAVGVASVSPRRIGKESGVLGIRLGDSEFGPSVSKVIEGSGAEKAGMKADDVVTHLDGTAVPSRRALVERIQQRRPGDRVKLTIRRDEATIELEANLGRYSDIIPDEETLQNSIGGPLSKRRTGFLSVIQHDTLLQPHQCGGPLVDLDGKMVGVNIARAGRVATYALTADVVQSRLADLKSGRLAPGKTDR